MTEAICKNCGHGRNGHVDKWGGICVGCPCPGFESADAAESLPAQPEQELGKVWQACGYTMCGLEDCLDCWPMNRANFGPKDVIAPVAEPKPTPSTEPSDMQKQMEHDDGLITTLQEDTKRLRKERAEWTRKYFEISRALSGTIDKNGDLIKRIQWLEHEKDEIRNSKSQTDSSSISTEQTFEEWWATYDTKGHGVGGPSYGFIARAAWNAAKG